MNRFETVDDVNRWILRETLQHGDVVNPRGQTTKELLAISFCLTNIRARIVANPARHFSLPLALGEFCWHVAESNEVDALAYYAPRWRDFSDDGVHVSGSCYGRKIFGATEGLDSPWNRVVETLRHDPASRRAVLSLWDERLAPTGRDLPCTMTIQFLIRKGRLVSLVHMRSNDAVWGIPYDVFFFTMLQEYLATCLHVEVGEYFHFASSMHLYERHFKLAEKILTAETVDRPAMPAMSNPEELSQFVKCERLLREGADAASCAGLLQSSYWRALLSPLIEHQQRSAKWHHVLTGEASIQPVM